MGPVAPSRPLHLVLLFAEASTEQQGGSPGAAGPPPTLSVPQAPVWQEPGQAPGFRAGKAVRIAPIQLPGCAHISWRPGDRPAHFCLDVCQGGVGMAT